MDSREKAEQMMVIAREAGSHRFTWDHLNAAGDVFPAEVMLTWIDNAEQQDERFLAIVRDLTEQHALDARLRRAERLRTLGVLAGGVAHDFNNLLSVVRLHADALGQLDIDLTVREHAAAISQSVDVAAALTQQLLSFSKGEMVLPRAVDVAEIVAKATPLLRSLAGEHITVTFKASGAANFAVVDSGQIEQVLINVVVNARDAMPNGGTIDIDLETERRPSFDCEVDELTEMVVLSVTDTGVGMNDSQVADAFEPFVSTKAETGGTGLGLSVVQAIAEQNGGWVELRSTPGVGTTVQVRFPRTTDTPFEGERELSPNDSTDSTRVLLVEDHQHLRKAVGQLLELMGHDVVSVANGAEALQFIEERGEFDIVVTDVVMPGMSGPELIASIAAASTGTIRAVLMSGHAPNPSYVPPDGVDCRILSKPFSRADLEEAMS
jgi:signal transduction histidine kinase